MKRGGYVLALHGHMPWVMRHGRWPHGDHWLYEAACDVYLPLLEVVEELDRECIVAPFVLGLTPVLLEQLRHPDFAAGCRAYLDDRLLRSRRDATELDRRPLAQHWEQLWQRRRDQLDAMDADLVGAFSGHAQAGRLELLSSFATHGYAALLLQDASIRGQLRTGLDTSERHLGFRPRGIWLPECSFRLAGPWTPPVLHGDERVRKGVDGILADEGVGHFVVDHHLVTRARSEALWEGGPPVRVDWEESSRSPWHGWQSPMVPHRVNTEGGLDGPVAFARHPELSEQVWSADVGYPGDPRYLEFHKRKDGDGLRYWRVTDRKAGLGDKRPYDPQAVREAIYLHARHFASTVRDRLARHQADNNRPGVVCTPFDAELFGHWWHEGPRFLLEALKALHHDPEVEVETMAGHMARCPPATTVWLPEGSWGEEGDHRVWLNADNLWTWEAGYRAEDRFLGLLAEARSAPDGLGTLRAWELLHKAGRELLLLQASDWNFVVHTGGAADYGRRRIGEHLGRFDHLCTMAADVLAGRPVVPWEQHAEALYDELDLCFPAPALDAWG